jgi:hypothetical protein
MIFRPLYTSKFSINIYLNAILPRCVINQYEFRDSTVRHNSTIKRRNLPPD